MIARSLSTRLARLEGVALPERVRECMARPLHKWTPGDVDVLTAAILAPGALEGCSDANLAQRSDEISALIREAERGDAPSLRVLGDELPR